MRAAGVRNLARAPGFQPAPLERLMLRPPAALVRGFFDTARFSRWQLGRHAALERLAASRPAADLPGSVLGCPAWFAGEGARRLAEAAPRR
jgi:iron complex transport system substrate-binding protein